MAENWSDLRPDIWCQCGHRYEPGPGSGDHHVEGLGCTGCICTIEERPKSARAWGVAHGYEKR